MSVKGHVIAQYLGHGDPALANYYPAWLDNMADDATVEGSLRRGGRRVPRQNGHNVRRGRVRESRDQVDRAGRRQYVGIWGRPGKSPPCGD
jgi:hypothetical protein